MQATTNPNQCCSQQQSAIPTQLAEVAAAIKQESFGRMKIAKMLRATTSAAEILLLKKGVLMMMLWAGAC